MIEEANICLTPINFFQLRIDCPYLKEGMPHPLPNTSALCNEISFSQVSMGWNEEGLHFNLISKRPFQRSVYPSVHKGDSFEVFIDTRDMKTASFNTRFCHHFFCFPAPTEEEIQAGEITRFRTEDSHELCKSTDLVVRSELFPKGYALDFFIPKHCLHGYEPEQFNRLGMTYRVNSFGGATNHFSLSGNDYQIDQQPSLWSSVRLIK